MVTVDVPAVSTASTAVFVNTGSRYEPIELNGISHFLEHMAFKGTGKRSAYNIANDIERVGADINAFTSKENTAYYVISLAEHTELALDIISDVLTNSTFPQDELDRERGVILQEMAMVFDEPSHLVYDFYDTAAYPNQDYGRTILGDPELIKRATRDDFKNYMNKHYVTGNMIVVCAGKVNHDNFVKMVEKYFSTLPKGDVLIPQQANYVGGYHHYNKDFEQANIIFGFPTCNIYDDEHVMVDVLSAVFGGGMSSPLFTEVREKRGLVYSVRSMAGRGVDYGDFAIAAGTTPDNINEFFEVSTNELLKLTHTINEDDVYRAKNQIKAHTLMSLERPFSVAQRVVQELFLFGQPKSVDEYIEKVDSISIDNLKYMASKILSGKPTLSIVGTMGTDDYYDYLIKKFA